MVATSPLADNRSVTKRLVSSETSLLENTTIMPLPMAAGVLGMQRTTGAWLPRISSKVAAGVPAAMLTKVVRPSPKRL